MKVAGKIEGLAGRKSSQLVLDTNPLTYGHLSLGSHGSSLKL